MTPTRRSLLRLTLALPVPPAWLGPLGLALSAGHQLLLSLDLTRLLAPGGAAGKVSVLVEGGNEAATLSYLNHEHLQLF